MATYSQGGAAPSGATPALIEATRQVAQLFRKAWPRAKRYPDFLACYPVAVAIHTIRAARSAANSERAKREREAKKVAESKNAIALKYARLLLLHLPVLRQYWEAEYEQQNREQRSTVFLRAKRVAVLDAIEQIERPVRVLIEASEPVRRPQPNPAWPQPNPATDVAFRVQRAWSGVHGAKGTKSNKPDAPLCAFVRDALALAGKHYTLSTVSDMLRERHRCKRPARSRS